jgi:transcriptional regulator with XRE-family HTH domain
VWTVGDYMRKARESAGLSQPELAELIGVSRLTISNTERGVTRPRKIVVNAWSFATGVPVEWLLTGKCAIRDSNPEPADVVPLFGGDAA